MIKVIIIITILLIKIRLIYFNINVRYLTSLNNISTDYLSQSSILVSIRHPKHDFKLFSKVSKL